VRKPLLSREGANVTLVSAGVSLDEHTGPYGAEGFVRQALSPLPNFSGFYSVVGSWLVNHEPCGLSIREDESPITGNSSRFLPHAIL
jgi:glutathionylspermidine synthase